MPITPGNGWGRPAGSPRAGCLSPGGHFSPVRPFSLTGGNFCCLLLFVQAEGPPSRRGTEQKLFYESSRAGFESSRPSSSGPRKSPPLTFRPAVFPSAATCYRRRSARLFNLRSLRGTGFTAASSPAIHFSLRRCVKRDRLTQRRFPTVPAASGRGCVFMSSRRTAPPAPGTRLPAAAIEKGRRPRYYLPLRGGAESPEELS